jgi:DNA polymerase-3 subunit delta
MRLRAEQLAQHLQPLQSVYLVSGDEQLLVQEACSEIRRAAREQGCSEREVLCVEKKFDWNALHSSSAEMSLFAERKLIELRIPNGKPGVEGSKALVSYLADPSPDNCLLIIAGKIDKKSTSSKWYNTIDKAGACLQIWPVDARQLPRWMKQRLRQGGLDIDDDALQVLCDRVEGNLLTAVQEIEKLQLLTSGNVVSLDNVNEAVADSARYNLFALLDHALLGETGAALKMMAGLRSEGTDATVVLWGLAREIRLLCQCQAGIERGQNSNRVLQAQRVWEQRKPVVTSALARHSGAALDVMLQQAADCDRAIKGMADGKPWDRLEQLLLALSGPGFRSTSSIQA